MIESGEWQLTFAVLIIVELLDKIFRLFHGTVPPQQRHLNTRNNRKNHGNDSNETNSMKPTAINGEQQQRSRQYTHTTSKVNVDERVITMASRSSVAVSEPS